MQSIEFQRQEVKRPSIGQLGMMLSGTTSALPPVFFLLGAKYSIKVFATIHILHT